VTLLSNIIERRDFTVIFPILSKIRRDFAIFYRDFLPALSIIHTTHMSQSTIILTMTFNVLSISQSINQSQKL